MFITCIREKIQANYVVVIVLIDNGGYVRRLSLHYDSNRVDDVR